MINHKEPFTDSYSKRLQMFFYLVPIVGFFPSLWTLYRREGDREQQSVSRLSVTLALIWVSAYLLLAGGAQISELFTLRLLFINGLLTSSYFLVSLWLMARLWQRQSIKLPGVSSLAEGVFRKRLS